MKRTFLFLAVALFIVTGISAQTKNSGRAFTESLMQDTCEFTTTGRNTYFILEPGYQLTLEDKAGGRLVITVLNETKKIGNVETRVIEENESKNGKTVEVSRNFFAFCRQTSSVYYFGEEVDIYKGGKIANHEGAWIAGGKNKAGIFSPGLVLLGARFYSEIAPGIAMDRMEVISMSETKTTPAGTFSNCLKVEETTDLDAKDKEFKIFAPGIGIIQDGDLLLTKYGFVK